MFIFHVSKERRYRTHKSASHASIRWNTVKWYYNVDSGGNKYYLQGQVLLQELSQLG